jgi:hypothetical protein
LMHAVLSNVGHVSLHKSEELLEVLASLNFVLDHKADGEGHSRQDVTALDEKQVQNCIGEL